MPSRSTTKSFDQLIPRATSPAAQCYRPDGTAVASIELVPCNAVIAAQGQGSMCCDMGIGSQNDTCDPTGLCKNDGNYYRDSCTDETWSSPNCLQNICTNSKDFGSNTGSSLLYDCGIESGNPSFCCGTGRSNCCGNTTAVFTLAPTLVAQGASETTAVATVTSTSSSNTQTTKSGGTSGATIGLAVALGVVALALAAGFLLRRNWRRGQPKESFAGGNTNAQGFGAPTTYFDNYHEAPTDRGAVELSSGQQDLMYPQGVSELGQRK